MDLVEYSYFENYDSPAFLCAKLVYKSLAYIFNGETPKVTSLIVVIPSIRVHQSPHSYSYP